MMSDSSEINSSSEGGWDSEAFSIPPRFSTIRVNMLDKGSENMEDDLKDYLRKVSHLCILLIHSMHNAPWWGSTLLVKRTNPGGVERRGG